MILEEKLKSIIKEVPDFPKKGISFKDITPLLLDHSLFDEIVSALAKPYQSDQIDFIAGVEARGFLFGMALAKELNAGFIPIRKQGKLPRRTLDGSYALEYGTATIEVHQEDIVPGSRILIHDDLLATGGTANAAHKLLSSAGASVIGYNFLVELDFLSARNTLLKTGGGSINSLIRYNQ